jgi:hypothetical protein
MKASISSSDLTCIKGVFFFKEIHFFLINYLHETLPPLSTRRKIARITLLHKAIHEKVAIPLNQRELRDSIIRRDTYKSDRKKMFTNSF